jgi:hypothetical protein
MALSARTRDEVGDMVRSVRVRMWRERGLLELRERIGVEVPGRSLPKYRNVSIPTYTCNHLSFDLAVSEAGEGAAAKV